MSRYSFDYTGTKEEVLGMAVRAKVELVLGDGSEINGYRSGSVYGDYDNVLSFLKDFCGNDETTIKYTINEIM
jgi:hypothetical protein